MLKVRGNTDLAMLNTDVTDYSKYKKLYPYIFPSEK